MAMALHVSSPPSPHFSASVMSLPLPLHLVPPPPPHFSASLMPLPLHLGSPPPPHFCASIPAHNCLPLCVPPLQATHFPLRNPAFSGSRLLSLLASPTSALGAQSLCCSNFRSRSIASNCTASPSGYTGEVGTYSEQVGKGVLRVGTVHEGFVKEKEDSPNYFLWIPGILLLFVTRSVIMVELLRWITVAGRASLMLINYAKPVLKSFLLKARKPLALSITLVGSIGLFAKHVYAFAVTEIPVWATLQTLFFCTVVLSLGEAVRSTSVSGQLFILNLTTLLGLGMVLGFLPLTRFFVLLLAVASFSVLVKKVDTVSAFLPVVLVLTAVLKPWMKGVALALFLVLSMYSNWKAPEEQSLFNFGDEHIVHPIVMLVAAVMVAMRVIVPCLYAWHLCWLAR